MLQFELFVGTPIDGPLEQALQAAKPQLRQLFIGSGPDYLTQIEDKGVAFIGKKAGSLLSVEELPLLESHIRSLLLRLVPPTALATAQFSVVAILAQK